MTQSITKANIIWCSKASPIDAPAPQNLSLSSSTDEQHSSATAKACIGAVNDKINILKNFHRSMFFFANDEFYLSNFNQQWRSIKCIYCCIARLYCNHNGLVHSCPRCLYEIWKCLIQMAICPKASEAWDLHFLCVVHFSIASIF